jgi:hypothetical protein
MLFSNTEIFENVAEDFVDGSLINKIVTIISSGDSGEGQHPL